MLTLFFCTHTGRLCLSSICLLRFSLFESEIILKVCLISECFSSWLSFSKEFFILKCCFLSFDLILCVILFFTLDLGKNGSEGTNYEAENYAKYMLIVKHVN